MHNISLGETVFDVFGNYAYTGVEGKDEAEQLVFQLLGCEVSFKESLPSICLDGPFYISLTINRDQHILVISTNSDDIEIETTMVDIFNELNN